MAGKIEIPERLKQDLPPNHWGKTLGATPIVMTVIATMLAGLASSEMTRAQYDRSLAAQLQSKAGDQWGYYQAKKVRSALAQDTLDLLAATGEVAPLPAAALSNANPATISALIKNQLPDPTPVKFPDNVQAALKLLEESRPEPEISAALARVPPAALAACLREALNAAQAFDKAIKPISQGADRAEASPTTADKGLFRSFTAARLRYTVARYDLESRLNLTVAEIYELQVRQNNDSAERHHERSGKFFFGMLAAQFAVIVSTFALAARQHSFLWSFAAAAGAGAVAFSVYVYLCL
jgi:hypothetical protein